MRFINFIIILNLVFIHWQKFIGSASQVSSHESNHKKCHGFFDKYENRKFKKDLIDCVVSLASKTHCGGVYDPPCLCNSYSFHHYLSPNNPPRTCFSRLSYGSRYYFIHQFSRDCITGNYPKSCKELNKPKAPVFCPDPYKGQGFSGKTIECFKKYQNQSGCNDDAVCYCDDYDFRRGFSKCLFDYDIGTVGRGAEKFLEELCSSPSTFPGCKKGYVPPPRKTQKPTSGRGRIGMGRSRGRGRGRYTLKKRTTALVKRTYCDSTDIACLCDSRRFIDATARQENYDVCFSKMSSNARQSYLKYKETFCSGSNPSYLCNLDEEPFYKPVVCFDPYKDANFGDNLEKCLMKAAKNSLCKQPYDSLCLCDSMSYLNAVSNCVSGVSDEERNKVQNFHDTICRNPTLLSGCRTRSELLSLCKDVFDKTSFTDELKVCLRKIAEKSPCKGSYDPTCLCNSNYFSDSTLHHSTYDDCFSALSVNDRLAYAEFYANMCKAPQSPSALCAQLQVSTQEPVLCSNVYNNLGFTGKFAECMKDALRESRCSEPYDAVCLCDSKSYWDAAHKCAITIDNDEYKAFKNFKKTLCENPRILSGCDLDGFSLSKTGISPVSITSKSEQTVVHYTSANTSSGTMQKSSAFRQVKTNYIPFFGVTILVIINL